MAFFVTRSRELPVKLPQLLIETRPAVRHKSSPFSSAYLHSAERHQPGIKIDIYTSPVSSSLRSLALEVCIVLRKRQVSWI